MIDALWFWLSILFWIAFGVVVLISAVRRERERAALVAEIRAQPALAFWISEDGTIHTTRSRNGTLAMLRDAITIVEREHTDEPAAGHRPQRSGAGGVRGRLCH